MGNVALGSFPAIKVISMRIFFLVKIPDFFQNGCFFHNHFFECVGHPPR